MSTIQHYIIVVHGIGEQKKNTTAIQVLDRFAQNRQHYSMKESRVLKPLRNVMTLGKACGQTGLEEISKQPWMEFKGIPQNPPAADESVEPFIAERSDSGTNLRFVEIHWSDIMQHDAQYVVESPTEWADAIVGRLETKSETLPKGATLPIWIPETLRLVRETAGVLNLGCKVFDLIYNQELGKTIFEDFLGDVQQYGEYSRCRGQAVYRFHEIMVRLEEEHREREQDASVKTEPCFTIIAHSLGTIMSLDALLYAHLTDEFRTGKKGIENLPFPGYDDCGPPLDTSWVEHVDSFVTLGSPIDKYLVVWWQNYKYLWNAGAFARQGMPIQHFNYCEEQDPVGHHLDYLQRTDVYHKLFEAKIDRVYNRYSIPGAAHCYYFEDQVLFDEIIDNTIDHDPHSVDVADEKKIDPDVWYNADTYRQILNTMYFYVPLAVVLSVFLTFSMALHSESFFGMTVGTLAFTGVILLGHYVLYLSIWWRQLSHHKYRMKYEHDGPETNLEDGPRRKRDRIRNQFRNDLNVWNILPIFLAITMFFVFITLEVDSGFQFISQNILSLLYIVNLMLLSVKYVNSKMSANSDSDPHADLSEYQTFHFGPYSIMNDIRKVGLISFVTIGVYLLVYLIFGDIDLDWVAPTWMVKGWSHHSLWWFDLIVLFTITSIVFSSRKKMVESISETLRNDMDNEKRFQENFRDYFDLKNTNSN